ncbi:MAG: HIT family protein [gamma proteobacterium symbiont of Bathyaustriella thionipta]|nr:HIT family protein [gamma proteobacterium symbiont of Bathyaustriella thionipta]MCU7949747.1 HIT family protein [gamma proteobacterium symbiont of Bathyaustriella thionipta]MCU7952484.1 HIT family protein [gamma proteobacterium symbiont of Bathyaustriella thionipta]MCU7956341.1 HIT family protein [gamma proteobacterium symbiont of Bathyaustriella thionipta]MCU7965816.1 HIT family protein [gamma proteobacterium symbiont of Bathyaustriella thionipta]
MNNFKLDSRLENDCFILSESEQFVFLLMNNSLVPWFILVPKTDKTELYELDIVKQTEILDAINKVSDFIYDEFRPDKLNIAAIGNIVNQMHIHIVGRYKTDTYWPGVVWGASEKQAYKLSEVEKIKAKSNNILEL